jgi:hypothetical protein
MGCFDALRVACSEECGGGAGLHRPCCHLAAPLRRLLSPGYVLRQPDQGPSFAGLWSSFLAALDVALDVKVFPALADNPIRHVVDPIGHGVDKRKGWAENEKDG